MRRLSPVLAAVAVALCWAPSASAIVGGQPVPAGGLPYVANITVAGTFGCTGTLIAKGWVMTAGHCASLTGELGGTPLDYPPSAYTLTLGTVKADGEGGETHTVKAVHHDPNYLIINGTGSDVSLLELSAPSDITPLQIAAPGERSIWEPGDTMTIAGFGTTASGGPTPDTLQVAKVPIVADADCSRAYNDATPVLGNAFDPRTAVCAGYPQGGVDTCQGDSGGPLLAPLAGDTLRLVGSTSYGEGCAQAGKPGVYGRVAEGSVKAFVARYVPEAYATGTADPGAPTPAPDATSCTGRPGLAFRVRRPAHARLRRARVTVAGKRLVNRRGKALKAFRVDIAAKLSRAGTTTVKVITLSSKRIERTSTRTYRDCRRISARTHTKRL